jgi:hypothetical protein
VHQRREGACQTSQVEDWRGVDADWLAQGSMVGSGDPILGPLATSVFAMRVLTFEDVLLHSRFLVVCAYGGRPTSKSDRWSLDLTCRCVVEWTSPWYVQNHSRVCFRGHLTPPHLVHYVLDHINKGDVKCRGSAGGNTPTEPKILLISVTNHRHKLHW